MARTHPRGWPIDRDGAPIADREPEGVVPRPSNRPGDQPAGADSALHLRAPSPEEAWRVSAAAPRPAAGDPAAAPQRGAGPSTELPATPIAAVSQAPSERRTLSAGMGFAALIVTAVLVGMALLSHGNGP